MANQSAKENDKISKFLQDNSPDWFSEGDPSNKETLKGVHHFYALVKNQQGYRYYYTLLAHQQRYRYVELEEDFRALVSNDQQANDSRYVKERIVDLLASARPLLCLKNPYKIDHFTVSSILASVERLLIRLYTPQIAQAKAVRVISELRTVDVAVEDPVLDKLKQASQSDGENPQQDNRALDSLRAVFEGAFGILDSHRQRERLLIELQVRRNTLLLWAGITALVVSLIISYCLVEPYLKRFSYILGVLLVGAMGGLLSGLIQVRNTQFAMSNFQVLMGTLLWLRPVVGAIIASILFILLSWGMLPGIKIENDGSYFLFAFLSGFSERYFLQLMKLNVPNGEAGSGATGSETATDQPKQQTESQ